MGTTDLCTPPLPGQGNQGNLGGKGNPFPAPPGSPCPFLAVGYKSVVLNGQKEARQLKLKQKFDGTNLEQIHILDFCPYYL